jgi:fructose 1,6-bisphosphate aldolase/phosphatase
MPVAQRDATPSRFDGPPRVVALGFQLANGKLIGPRDMFDDVSFNQARTIANEMAYHMRRQGPFEPARLPMDEMEYTTMPQIMERFGPRFEPIESEAREEILAGAASHNGSELD